MLVWVLWSVSGSSKGPVVRAEGCLFFFLFLGSVTVPRFHSPTVFYPRSQHAGIPDPRLFQPRNLFLQGVRGYIRPLATWQRKLTGRAGRSPLLKIPVAEIRKDRGPPTVPRFQTQSFFLLFGVGWYSPPQR